MVLWLGTAVDDSHRGTPEADRLEGLDGNDRLWGEGGDDTILGGAGDDRLWGGAGHDFLFGEDGNDGLVGGLGDDSLRGGPGDDRLDGDAGNDQLWGGLGQDTLKGSAGNDRLSGGPGNDWLDGGTGEDDVYGGDGNDTIENIGPGDEVRAGGGDDLMVVRIGPIYLPDLPGEKAVGLLDGGSGFDTVRVHNQGFTFDYPAKEPTVPASVLVWASGNPEEPGIPIAVLFIGHAGESWPEDPLGAYYAFSGIERVEAPADSSRRMHYDGSASLFRSMTVIGGDGNDTFRPGPSREVLDGGKGNDTFYLEVEDLGTDHWISDPDDADRFDFFNQTRGRVTLTGFNGQGEEGGDVLDMRSLPDLTVTESPDGTTLFAWQGVKLVVDAVGLVQGVDYLT